MAPLFRLKSRLEHTRTAVLAASIGAGLSLGCTASGSANVEARSSLDTAPDRDDDGVADSADACPDEFGPAASERNRAGCPRPEASDADAAEVGAAAALAPATPSHAPVEPVARETDKGVAPAVQRETLAPTASKQAGGEPAVVTYAGYRVRSDQSSTLYVNLTSQVPVEMTKKGNRIDYVMTGARIGWRNNRNPLLAQHFGASVQTARLVPVGKNVRLEVTTRGNAQPQHRVVNDAGGFVTLRIDFAAPRTGPSESPR